MYILAVCTLFAYLYTAAIVTKDIALPRNGTCDNAFAAAKSVCPE